MANRPRRFLLYSFAAVIPAIGLLAGTAAVASARTISAPAATHSAAAAAKAIAVSEIKKLTVGYHPTNHRVGVTSPGFKGLSDVTSTNWSGYADTGSSFRRQRQLDRAGRHLQLAHDLAGRVLGRHRRLQLRLGRAGRHDDRVL